MNRVWPYEYLDSHGDVLNVFPVAVEDADAAAVQVNARRAVDVPAAELAALVAALYAAAGKPEPVILERPEGKPDRFRGIKIARNGDSVLLSIGGNRDALSASDADELAARIAILAAEIKADEPDPADVEELASALHRDRCDENGCDEGPDSEDRAAATAALRWMRDREGRPS